MRFYLDGTEYENPHLWETLQERFYFSDVIGGYLLEVTGSVEWNGGAYAYLRSLFLSGLCETVDVVITDKCADRTEKNVFTGLIFISDVEFELVSCTAIVEFVDNSFISKIDNNKSIKMYLGVDRSKNDVDISAFNNPQTNISLRTKANVADITNAKGWRIFDAFKMLIAFMTDGTVDFVSDFFDYSGSGTDDTAFYTVLMCGEEIRTSSGDVSPYISYEDFYNDTNKIFNLAFSVENTTGTPTIRIEPKSYYRQSGEVNYFNNPSELKQRVAKERLYAKVKFGSSQVAGTFTYLPDILFDGFEQEEFHLLGDCNSSAILDLQLSELITDTNIIQDVLPSGTGNTNYDENNFLVVLDSLNVNVSSLKIGSTTDYYYNQPINNYSVSVYWFGGIPQGIAQYLGNSNDTFQASFVSTTQSVLVNAQDIILFPDDTTPPNYDVNNNYNPANGHFTAPANGFYAFTLFQRIQAGRNYTTLIQRYDVTNVLLETISGGFFINPFIDGLTNVNLNPSPSNTDIFELNYTFGFQMTATDYVVIKACPYFSTGVNILQGTTWKCIYAVSGGGIVQEYGSEDMDLIENNFPHQISCEAWQSIKLAPFKTYPIVNGQEEIKGWISEIQRNMNTGEAQIFINSKPTA